MIGGGDENVSGNMNSGSPESRAKLAWHRSNENQLRQYKMNLDNLLSNIKVPDQLINCDGKSCDLHMYYIDPLGDDIIHSCLLASQEAISKSSSEKSIPKLTEMGNPAHETAMFCCSKPNTGWYGRYGRGHGHSIIK